MRTMPFMAIDELIGMIEATDIHGKILLLNLFRLLVCCENEMDSWR